MSEEIVNPILEEMEHDSAREDTLRQMIASAFEARTRVYTLIVGIIVVVATAVAVRVGIRFFQTDEVRGMILYATLFNTCMLAIATVRLFLWQLLLRQGVMREIKRLELRLVELAKNAAAATATMAERRENRCIRRPARLDRVGSGAAGRAPAGRRIWFPTRVAEGRVAGDDLPAAGGRVMIRLLT